MNYCFHRAALAEHLDQVAFYESRLAGLGKDYLAEFEALMAHICAAPDSYPQTSVPNIRKAGFRRFPFHMIYRVEPAQIVILAVAHHRRRPVYWAGRAGK